MGMATKIPPHNLSELVDGITYLIDNPDAAVDDLLRLIPGPDFPTAGLIMGTAGIRSAYATGRGRVVMRARAEIEEPERESDRRRIVVTELPYQVNKATLQEKIADLVGEKRLDGIANMRDESDRQGMRLVIELKRDARPQAVLNQLFKHTALQTAFNVNMVAVAGQQPVVLTLKTSLQQYIDYRQQVVQRRTRYDLRRARERAHILEGLQIALDNLDAVIRTIREAQSTEEARAGLIGRFGLSEVQANAILDMQLRRLVALERQRILDELDGAAPGDRRPGGRPGPPGAGADHHQGGAGLPQGQVRRRPAHGDPAPRRGRAERGGPHPPPQRPGDAHRARVRQAHAAQRLPRCSTGAGGG